jgi:hypothetical protein
MNRFPNHPAIQSRKVMLRRAFVPVSSELLFQLSPIRDTVAFTPKFHRRSSLFVLRALLVLPLLIAAAHAQVQAQDTPNDPAQSANASAPVLDVNWLYGAYVPKDAPLFSLNLHQRVHLFARQTFTTPGIYVKSLFLGLINQASGSPRQWGGGFEGYGKRVGSVWAQSAIQNVLSTAGNAALGYEPRYDRCRCDGFKPRTKHAFMRVFLTYNSTDRELRPQFALYAAAFGAGAISTEWKPTGTAWAEGLKGMGTQAGFGSLVNFVGEFAPEITKKLKRGKKDQ